MVLEAAIELHNQEQVVTRTTLETVLNLKRVSITESLSILEEEGLLDRVVSGVYVPAAKHPPTRIICKIMLPDGTVKVDIGDDVWTLTPKEARLLGSLFVGDAMQYSNIEIGRHAALTAAKMERQTKEMRREIRELQGLLIGSDPT